MAQRGKSAGERPRVTFVLIGCNQAQFMREAVAGALAQTYTPLQIILSDDASTDGTFEIMQEMAAAYNGPHTILLNRNERNLGLGGHINRVMELAEGALIVKADGDDISLPERTAVLVDEWLASGKEAHNIYSAMYVIDTDGAVLSERQYAPKEGTVRDLIPIFFDGVQGCSQAWTADVFHEFGPLPADCVYEDRLFPLRAKLLGRIAYTNRLLVKYRIHGENVSHFHTVGRDGVIAATLFIYKRNRGIMKAYMNDLRSPAAVRLMAEDERRAALEMARKEAQRWDDKAAFLSGGLVDKLRLVGDYVRTDPAQSLKWFAIMMCPWLYRWLQVRHWRRNAARLGS